MRAASSIALLTSLAASAVAAQPAEPTVERRIEVRLRDGVAYVQVELTARGASGEELALDEPVPEGAGLAGMRVCRGGRCRRGSVEPPFSSHPPPRYAAATAGPSAWVSQSRHALTVRARPLDPREPLVLTLRFTVPTTMRDGRDGITLPAYPRGSTHAWARALGGDRGEARRRRGPAAPSIDGRPARGAVAIGARPVRVEVPLVPGRVHAGAIAARCADRRCLRYRVSAAPFSLGCRSGRRDVGIPARGALSRPRLDPACPALAPRDVFLFLDASPSARHADPTHRREVLAALLASLPSGSSVRRVAFGWRARRLDHAPLAPEHVPLDAPLPEDLGPATRLSSAWTGVAHEVRSARDPLIVVIGDGRLGYWPSELGALRAIEADGAELATVDLIGRRGTSTLRGAVERSEGMSARIPAGSPPLSVAALAQPRIEPRVRVGDDDLGPLRGGQELLVERITDALPDSLIAGAIERRARGLPAPWDAGLGVSLALAHGVADPRRQLVAIRAVRVEREDSAGRSAGLQPRRAPRLPRVVVAPAQVRGAVGRGALQRLRARLVPHLRECFAAERRRGRRDAIRATLEILLQGDEVVLTRATEATGALARCAEEAPSHLGEIPHVDEDDDDLLRLRFPFVSEAISSPPAIPLAPDVARLVDAIE